jgi:hypothetical protein
VVGEGEFSVGKVVTAMSLNRRFSVELMISSFTTIAFIPCSRLSPLASSYRLQNHYE